MTDETSRDETKNSTARPSSFRSLFIRLKDFVYNVYIAGVVVYATATAVGFIYKLSFNLPAGFWSVNPSDFRFPFFFLGSLAVLLTSIGAISVAGRFSFLAWSSRTGHPHAGLFESCRNAFVRIQMDRQFHELYNLQTGLRFCFICSVVVAAMIGLASFEKPPHVDFVIVVSNCFHILLSTAYLVTSRLLYRSHTRLLLRLRISEDKDPQDASPIAQRVFWSSTILDLIFITLVYCSTLLPFRPFHFGYIIPVVTSWLLFSRLFTQAFVFILVGCILHLCLQLVVVTGDHQVAANIGLDGWRSLLPIGEFFLAIIFWFTIALILTFLHHAHRMERAKAAELGQSLQVSERVRLALEALSQKHAVFAKDIQQRFFFVNEQFRQDFARLRAQEGQRGSNVRLSRVTPEEILGKTEIEIGLGSPESEANDREILLGSAEFSGFEPGYSGSLRWTRKVRILDHEGNIIGLVGYSTNVFSIEALRALESLSRDRIKDQFGDTPAPLVINASIWENIMKSPDFAFQLAEVPRIAKEVVSTEEHVLAILGLLSHPSKATLRMELRGAGNSSEIPFSDFQSKLTEWWRDKSLSDDKWEDWATSINVRWLPVVPPAQLQDLNKPYEITR